MNDICFDLHDPKEWRKEGASRARRRVEMKRFVTTLRTAAEGSGTRGLCNDADLRHAAQPWMAMPPPAHDDVIAPFENTTDI